MRNQQAQLKGDFGKFWEAREWSTQQDGINASALIVTGLNDDNVTTKHADYMREAFLASGNNAKVILHQNAHGLPFDCDEVTTLGMGEHTYAEWVNLWLAHELCDMSNDVDSMADFLVQSNVDGLFYESDRDVPIAANVYYDYTIWLDPTYTCSRLAGQAWTAPLPLALRAREDVSRQFASISLMT